MLDLLARVVISVTILMTTVPLPEERAAAAQQTRSCPPQWPGLVRTCVA